MQKLIDKRTCYFDVDDTLVMWNYDIKNYIEIPSETGAMYVTRNDSHIELLINLKAIGWNIVVWSQGGSDHAERVIKALKLEKYVDIILPKPESYVDDIPFEQQYIKRIYKGEK